MHFFIYIFYKFEIVPKNDKKRFNFNRFNNEMDKLTHFDRIQST